EGHRRTVIRYIEGRPVFHSASVVRHSVQYLCSGGDAKDRRERAHVHRMTHTSLMMCPRRAEPSNKNSVRTVCTPEAWTIYRAAQNIFSSATATYVHKLA